GARGRHVGAGRAAGGPRAARADAALQEAPARDGRRRARAPRSRHVIDTHAHLDALDDDPGEVVARAREAGVTRILAVGMAQAVALAERFDDVFAIVGIHPHESAEGDLDEVRRLHEHPKAVAVGETGLDWYRDYAPRAAQLRVF